MNTKALMTSNRNDWETPWKLFDELNNEFHFTLDPCASDTNHKCDKYFTKKDDGLLKDWAGNNVFVNPPYGREIGKWVKKSFEESLKPNTKVVMLIPARTDTSYFHDYIYHKAELRFIRGRIKFEINGDNKGGCATFPSMIVIFKGESNI